MADFAQKTSSVAALRSITQSYPYSVGLLREILQNSDDAKASKQIIVLDRRTHTASDLHPNNLASTQGPALLAYNDATFNAADWKAIQDTYESSKATDSSKIGKYGVGFRSLFHITDCPQVISGNTFAMFDPLNSFPGAAGKMHELDHMLSNNPGQRSAFSSLMPIQGAFNETIIRCPLRLRSSKISSKVIRADDIAGLFKEFVSEEIDMSLLFLQHINQLEIRDIDERGTVTILAQLAISRSPPVPIQGQNTTTYITTVHKVVNGQKQEAAWRILHSRFNREEVVELLGKESSLETLVQHKLHPDIGIAIPLGLTHINRTMGRLFTFLPLPLPTHFPVHLHAYFALTQSRQNLRNAQEVGLVPGTDDHILVQWNKLLFSRYIPQAWVQLLEIHADPTSGPIFEAWPPEQRLATSGESVYWEALPRDILTYSIALNSPIWPVYETDVLSSQTEFQPLHSLLVAGAAIPLAVLRALSSVGLRITRPPQYIVDLVKSAAPDVILTPDGAHERLLHRCDQLKSAPKDMVDTILQYLLTEHNVLNLVDLPIIHLVNDEVISLSLAGSQAPMYTLLDEVEYDIFGAYDDHAIRLILLPIKVATTLRKHGPEKLNVEDLSVPRIVNYLTIYPNRLGLDLSLVKTDPRALLWLSKFWLWQHNYRHKDELFLVIRDLFLLPSTRGLRQANSPLFRSRGVHPNSVRHLGELGIPFIDDKLQETVQTILFTNGLLKELSDIFAVLEALSLSPPSSSLHLTRDACAAILTHFSFTISSSRAPLKSSHIQQLKSLPIYPVVYFSQSSMGLVHNCQNIPDGHRIVGVLGNPSFLPTIANVVFVQFPSHPTTAAGILDHIEPISPRTVDEQTLLRLTTEHFVDQPDHVHAAACKYMASQQHHIPPSIISDLRNINFVTVRHGPRRAPKDVIDPQSPLAALYSSNPEANALASTAYEQIIIRSLQTLKLLKSTLTIDVVNDRIASIASENPLSPRALEVSRTLLSLLISSQLDYGRISIVPGQKWLPTSRGLCAPEECRDKYYHSQNLFDEVLAILEPKFELPSSFRRAMGWDKPLPMRVLIDQLDRVLKRDGNAFNIVLEIIKEIGGRSWNDGELEFLKSVTADRNWVPTTEGTLADTGSTIFDKPIPESGFHQICHLDRRTSNLLKLLGCNSRPSTHSIIEKLNELTQYPPSLAVVTSALGLLRSLGPTLEEEERSQLVIPTTDDTLQPFADTFFNDIGENAKLVPVTEHTFISHAMLDEALAEKLLLGRLGLKYVGLSIPGVEMGEKLVTTVRRTLKQYTEKQFVTEFLANAADAGATEFTILLNNFTADRSHLQALSPIMADFCTVPSLVVHNNAKFTDKDFTGICQTSIGGKLGRLETIGQFGLGALTMFHFTELAIIISDKNILFLNPSKGHLPLDRTSLFMTLAHAKQFYRSHLVPVDGFFGFDLSDINASYDGTIFILPLRTDVHCEGSVDAISRTFWTPDQVSQIILAALQDSASKALMFTRINRISGLTRQSSGNDVGGWSFAAERTHIITEADTGFTVNDLTLTDDVGAMYNWKIATTSVEHLMAQMPEELVVFSQEHRLRAPAAGLAMQFDDTSQRSKIFNFFATLPLGLQNSLPVHVNGSFILASDRRQIRLDDLNTLETHYNKWLLTNIVPALYHFLLALSLHLGSESDNKRWWPRDSENDDPYSRLIVEAFYSDKLVNSHRKILRSVYWPANLLSPQEAVLCGDESSSIRAALDALAPQRIAAVSRRVYPLATKTAGIAKVTPMFLKEELQLNPTAIYDLGPKIQEDIIGYLGPNPLNTEPVNLIGLDILPLENETFGKIVAQGDFEWQHYYVWMPKYGKRHNFPPHNFVHSKLSAPSLLKMGINVSYLTQQKMVELIDECLENASPFETLPQHTISWIEDFWESWDEYAALGLTPADIMDFPLVPTVGRREIFVSLRQCKEGAILIAGGSTDSDEQLRTCLSLLGLTVVRPDQEPTPTALCSLLQSNEYPKVSIGNVLACLQYQDDIAHTFDQVEAEFQEGFASWARRSIQTVPETLIHIALLIPIWPSVKRGSTLQLRAASEVLLLPNGIPLVATGRFMAQFVSNSVYLSHLLTPLALEDLGEIIELPVIMEPADVHDYRDFLRAWLALLPDSYNQPIRVPNSSRIVVSSADLYARDPIFEAAFGHDSDYFLAPELGDLQNALFRHHLRHQGLLNIQIFRTCAEAINGRQDDDLISRAAVLFDSYCVELPMHVDPNERDAWRELDVLSFVPRDMSTTRTLEDQPNAFLEIPPHITDLPSVVPPLYLVRQEFEAVAWSQRALFASQPHQRVLLAYPGLGRPDVSDVIRHLKVLSTTRVSSRAQRNILLHDLEHTYRFLKSNIANTTEEERSHLSDGELFLNVDDPRTDEWIWVDAEHLVFETRDTENSFLYVRAFLQPYAELLRSVGVLEVFHPNYRSDHSAIPGASVQSAIRQGFDKLRKQNQLTDVVFIASDSNSELPDSGDDADSPLIAHRAFLAVASEHFTAAFCGGYEESRKASPDDPVVVNVPDHSRQCVQSTLDYIYTGIQSTEDAPLELLLEIMGLSAYWRIADLFEDMQREITVRKMITPLTVYEIKDAAKAVDADNLFQACVAYEGRNAEFILRVRNRLDRQDGVASPNPYTFLFE